MQFKTFGKSSLRVSEVCLGTMTFGEDWGWGFNQEASRQLFDRYVEAGGNFIDTFLTPTFRADRVERAVARFT